MTNPITVAQTTLSQNFGGPAHNLAPYGAKFSLDDTPDQTGKVALVTGGSEGIGYALVHTLLRKNISKLYILSLSKDVIDDSIASIREEMGDESADKMKWIQCDICDWNKVSEVAFSIAKETDRLDIVVNNAARGIMSFQLTEHGIDRHMAANHMGHVVLTSHLLPLLKKTAEQGNTVRI